MGVPALFRWLSKKYPRIISAVEEEEPRKIPRQDGEEGEEELPIDMSGPNPNGEEFDCLYLDMNGIVHPCTHPEGKPAPETEEEMMIEVFAYTERVVNMVRPRRLLMMAIDGVAPRAKMNQQRSRRFRTAQEAKEQQEEKDAALAEWKASGLPVTDEAAESKKVWDSNAITPGTPFMDLLASSLRYWVAKKLNTDPGWKNLQVIISDASVPGEGEHKIMDFIRRQRVQPEHDPNTRHVIYGLDADLIMLSLATHEPYFKVLREDVFAQEQKVRKCHRCGREGHIAANCIGEAKEKQGEHDDVGAKPREKKGFIFLDVVALREYLEVELNLPGLPFKFDLERAIDDWVFLIFFVGNDFLPHLPSLEIREGAIDTLLRIWKRELPNMGSYLTNHGKVEMKNAQLIMQGIAKEEDQIFKKRKEQEERAEANAQRRKLEDHDRQRRELGKDDGSFKHGDQSYMEIKRARIDTNGEDAKLRSEALAALESGKNEDIIANQRAIRMANLSAAERLKAELKGKAAQDAAKSGKAKGDAVAEEAKTGDTEVKTEAPEVSVKKEETPEKSEEDVEIKIENGTEPTQRGQKRSIDDVEETQDSAAADDADPQEAVDPVTSTNTERKVNPDGTVEYEDTVKLWEPGYRERYYQQKFGVEADKEEFRRHVAKCYMEGMSWVLAYYYQGCPSWTWYFPYHFSPFAADFTNMEEFEIKFEQGKPFRPYDQLMGVLPAASKIHLPETFHTLMTDEDSEIIDFYPETFSIDMNGKKMAWQGVALLPFIDETRLLTAINERYDKLSEDELRRNKFGDDALMVAEENKLYDEICALYAKKPSEETNAVAINPANSFGINGFVRRDPNCIPTSTYTSPLTEVGLMDIRNDRSISALYDFPPQRTPHRSVLLKGVEIPKRVLTHEDREMARRGGPDNRGRGRGGHRGGGRGGRFSGGPYGHDQNRQGPPNAPLMRFGPTQGSNGTDPNQPPYQNWNTNNGYGAQNGYGQQAAAYGGYGNGSYPPPQQGGGQPQRYGAPPQGQQQQGYGQYGGYGGYGNAGGGGYESAPGAAPYSGYGGYGNANNTASTYGGYGGYGNANSSNGGYAQPAYGGYGQGANGYGNQANNAPYGQQPPPQQYGNYGQGNAYGAAPPSGPRGGSGPPRPMGYHTGAPGGGGGGGRGGRGRGGHQGPYGRY